MGISSRGLRRRERRQALTAGRGHSLFVPLAVQAVTAVCAQGPGREPVAELAAGTTAFEHVVHDLLLVDSRRSLDRNGCPRGTADGYSEPMLQRAAVLLAAGLALAGTAPAAGRTARAPVHAELRPTAGASRAHGSFSAGLSASSEATEVPVDDPVLRLDRPCGRGGPPPPFAERRRPLPPLPPVQSRPERQHDPDATGRAGDRIGQDLRRGAHREKSERGDPRPADRIRQALRRRPAGPAPAAASAFKRVGR